MFFSSLKFVSTSTKSSEASALQISIIELLFSHYGVPSAATDVAAKFHQRILFFFLSHVSSVLIVLI